MGRAVISKDPEDYRFEPPPERTETARTVVLGTIVTVASIPGILALIGQWNNDLPGLKAIAIGVLALIARRLLRGALDRSTPHLRRHLPRLPRWEPSKDPKDYR